MQRLKSYFINTLKWFNRFGNRQISVECESRSERPSTIHNEQIIDQFGDIVTL